MCATGWGGSHVVMGQQTPISASRHPCPSNFLSFFPSMAVQRRPFPLRPPGRLGWRAAHASDGRAARCDIAPCAVRGCAVSGGGGGAGASVRADRRRQWPGCGRWRGWHELDALAGCGWREEGRMAGGAVPSLLPPFSCLPLPTCCRLWFCLVSRVPRQRRRRPRRGPSAAHRHFDNPGQRALTAKVAAVAAVAVAEAAAAAAGAPPSATAARGPACDAGAGAPH